MFSRAVRLAILIVLGLSPARAAAAAHEIPNDVTVHIYVRPDGERLTLLVRAPLEAMRDIEWPLRGPGYLDLEASRDLVEDAVAVWLANDIALYEGAARVGAPAIAATRVSLPSDPAFQSYEGALARLGGAPLGPATDLYWQQALVDARLEYAIGSGRSEFSIRPGLDGLGLRVLTIVRFLPPDGVERVFRFEGDPGRVVMDPGWWHAARTFVRFGFGHILEGFDHLLFLLCLVIPVRRLGPLVTVVTAFTLAHSITLIASAYGMVPNTLWFPPLVETLIAASIVYMAIENSIRRDVEHRWLVAFGFGLIHGFGFSFALGETLQLAGDHLPTALFSFNIGVELGQLLILLLLIPTIRLFLRLSVSERAGTIVLSVLVGHTAWHWMTERGSALGEYSWPGWPALPALLRWTMLAVIVIGAGWLFSMATRPFGSNRSEAAR